MRINLFDKICAVLAFVLGVIFMLLGGLGIFTGCSANFTLPPILGGLPLLIGWGIIKAILVAWNKSASEQRFSSIPYEQTSNDDPRIYAE
ncbi:MAG: hypothetical protein KAS23_13290 [Anaerohalosphaera sp.]|nr:hypothetical protein [Anaerohalosphaera sp.]